MLSITLEAAVPPSPDNPLGCEPGRNTGNTQPRWWPKVRALIVANKKYFPPDLDLPFLGAWIEHESSGRHALSSVLGEVGYFQVHPAEIEDLVGADKVESVVAAIQASPAQSVQWGGTLLSVYDRAIAKFDIARGTEMYHALLKVMHASWPRGSAWLKHVIATLGRNPTSFNEFLTTATALKSGSLKSPLDKPLPRVLPGCAPEQLLARRETFMMAEDQRPKIWQPNMWTSTASSEIERQRERRNRTWLYVGLGAAATTATVAAVVARRRRKT